MIERITEYLMNWCERKGRVLKITGTAGPEDVYLIRYYVIQSRFFNIFIHQFLRSDRDDLHDHPWNFATYLVRGAYTEKKWNPKTNQIDCTERENVEYENLGEDYKTQYTRLRNNRLVFRKATDQHQVVVDIDLPEVYKDQAPLTICITGRTKREWGFWKEETIHDPLPSYGGYVFAVYRTKQVRRWVPWREYLGLPPDAKGRG